MLHHLNDFLDPVSKDEISGDNPYADTQIGHRILCYGGGSFPELDEVSLVLIGCNEFRGAGPRKPGGHSADEVRTQFYQLHHWHQEIKVADLGNVRLGASLADTYAALREVMTELLALNKKVILLGGSHDLTMAMYQVYAHQERQAEITVIDAAIDIQPDSPVPEAHFLLDILTGEPNYVRHYNHIGFQSYLVHPQMLETIDKLRFDCYRLGKVKEQPEEMEPALRNSQLLSLDISAIQHAHAPANRLTPNGFDGEMICTLMQYAGMSPGCALTGLFGYRPADDLHRMTAIQLAHMIWYFMDGMHKHLYEAPLEDASGYNKFTTLFAEVNTNFLQSKSTGRWWMEMMDGEWVACSHNDYLLASNNDYPERWLRAAERPV